jgi:hypothetical protein
MNINNSSKVLAYVTRFAGIFVVVVAIMFSSFGIMPTSVHAQSDEYDGYQFGSDSDYDYSGGYDYGDDYGYDYSGGYDYSDDYYDYEGGYSYDDSDYDYSYDNYSGYDAYSGFGDYGNDYDYYSYYPDYSYDYYYDTPTYYYDTPTYTYVPPTYTYTPPTYNPPHNNPPHYSAPTCTLNASDTSIEEGQTVTLTWTTSNATSATLSNFGSVSTGSGSRSANPSNQGGTNVTYTMHVTGQGGSANCDVTIHVNSHPVNHNVSCDISADDTSIEDGDSVRLEWNSNNANSARINQGIGSVSTNSSRTVRPSDDTTYTLTVTNDQGDQATCSVTVRVHENNDLSCDLTASDTHIENGDSTTLRWDTDGDVDSARINQGIGSVDEDGGSKRVSPDFDTTYRMTVEDRHGNEETCSVTVRVDSNDISINYPPNQPLVYLSQLPYTGLDLTPGEWMAYILALIGGAALIGYFVFSRVMPFALARVKSARASAIVSNDADAPAVVENVTRQEVRAFVSALAANDMAAAREFASANNTALFSEAAVVLDDVRRARANGTVADAQVAEMTADWNADKLDATIAKLADATSADEALG